MKKLWVLVPLFLVAETAQSVSVFTFEGGSEGSATEFSESVDGIEADLAQGGDSFWITEMPTPRPTGWGNRQLLTSTSEKPIVVTFSEFVSNVRLYATDFGADADWAYMEAWSGDGATGTLLDDTSVSWGSSEETPGFLELLIDAEDIKSVRFWSVSEFGDNSLYWDNLTVNAPPAVPEPATIVALLIGGLALSRRKGRRP